MGCKRWMAWSLLLLGCYNPNIRDEQYICATTADCPSGFKCSDCLTCIAEDEPSSQCTSPCTNGNKQRVPGDPQNPSVALCPAAWLVSGFSTPERCNRQPDPDGSGCAPIDNCAPGWHVCTASDLERHGFTQAACGSSSIAGFFVADQPGGLDPVSQSPTCGVAGDAFFGCGNDGDQNVAGCTILSRSTYAYRATPTSPPTCFGMPEGWVCSQVGQGTTILLRATGNSTAPASLLEGGVMCCR
jgi:hypothetical protein